MYKIKKGEKIMQLFKKILLILIGVALIGLGIAIALLNNWGVDPVTVFAQALSIKLLALGWTFFNVGNTLIVMNMIIFVILISIYKMKYINIGTFIGMFCVGIFINLWVNLLSGLILENSSIILKIVWMIIGVVIMSVGVGMYISSNMGASPFDLIPVVLSDELRIKYSIMRVISDFSFVFLGWIFGGVVGVTTILLLCCIGPISGLVIKYARKYLRLEV